jgi:hypothetical protein
MSQPRASSVAHAGGMRESDASPDKQNASPGQEQHNSKEEENRKKYGNAAWQSIKADLISIKEGLEKEEGGNARWIEELSSVITRVPQAALASTNPQGVEARLERIEALLQTPNTNTQTIPTQGATWAKIAAKGVRQAGALETPHPVRHTVRVQMAQAKGMGNEEILKEIRKTISGAAAIRVLHSGDIDVTVPDEAARDRAQGLPSTGELKIFKRDYLVEVPSVPLSVRVACEKGADNSHLAAMICEASRMMSPGLQITRIRWLHNQARREQQMREAGEKPAKTRGSLIVGFSTQEMQRQAVRGGLVIDAQLFETRLFERELQATQCFNCQQWGHTQRACGKRARCAQCAGDHASKDCPTDRVSCVNCGKQHRAYQRRECTSFQAYFQGIQYRRVALYSQAISIRAAVNSTGGPERRQTLPTHPTLGEGWAIVSRKRGRVMSPTLEDTQRRLGRPTYIEQAARDPAQQRLGFSQSSASVSQATSMETTPTVEVSMTQDES